MRAVPTSVGSRSETGKIRKIRKRADEMKQCFYRSNLVLRVVMSRSLKARATARLLATARVLPWIFHSSSDNPSQIRISSMQAEGELL